MPGNTGQALWGRLMSCQPYKRPRLWNTQLLQEGDQGVSSVDGRLRGTALEEALQEWWYLDIPEVSDSMEDSEHEELEDSQTEEDTLTEQNQN